MKEIKLPSLQHVARQWAPTPELVAKNLVALALSAPPFSYERLYSLARGVATGDSLEQVLAAVETAKLHPSARANYAEILPLVAEYFDERRPEFVNDVSPRLYPVGKSLLVPFKPPMIFFREGKATLPWFVFWRSQPLEGQNLRLFVSLVREMMEQDPDLEESSFPIIDCSAPDKKSPRRLTIVESHDVQLLTDGEKREMLEILVSGFELAKTTLARARSTAVKQVDLGGDDRQPDLFS